ncbi:MAG: transposase [Patescibacteria group bacterium]|nr:transposase [Patescibacteria group bacterium]
MPAKNIVKSYIQNGYCHIYNRGVEKRIIFLDEQDYKVFLNYLKIYLEPPTIPEKRTENINDATFTAPRRPLNNFNQEIELLAYCLIPNHFHLLVKQKSPRSIKTFMQSLLTKYSTYFNKRYKRVGTLFQGTYKAILIEEENYLLHLSRYIHLNPAKYVKDSPLHIAHSSYGDYLSLRKTNWVDTNLILSFFKSAQRTHLKDMLSYQSFAEDYLEDSEKILGKLIIEDDDM